MNNSLDTLIVVFDKKINKFRIVNIIEKTISFSSFDNECDAKNLINDIIDLMIDN